MIRSKVANKDDYTYEQLSGAFHNYLLERFDGETQEADRVVETAERILPNTLLDYFGWQIDSIYDLTDGNQIEELRRKIKAHPVLKNLDMSEEPRYTEVLKWYRLFRKAMNVHAVPIPVPGEYALPEEDLSATTAEQAAESRTFRTIYLEGEAGEAQPQELRRRNKQLRQACIDYYKRKHGGRVVCECCGFDFAKAYDIDDEYIEVHHLFPFSQTEGEHEVNSETDLVPLCANCHRMIHHAQGGGGNCMTLEELCSRYRGIRYN